MNHTPANVSSTNRMEFINHQRAARCSHSHTKDLLPGVHSWEFTLALIAFYVVAHCSTVIALLLAPVNPLLRVICKAITTTYHKRVVDTGNCKTRGFEIVTRRTTPANKFESKESILGPPPTRGFGVIPPFIYIAPFLKCLTLNTFTASSPPRFT
jgi:hypothetical protein